MGEDPRFSSKLSCIWASGVWVGSHLIAPVLADELRGHVCREYILQEEPGQVLHCLGLLSLPPQFLLPQEVQAAVILILG